MKNTSGNRNFINLHNHTARGSLLDSILTVEQLVKFAVDNDQNSIAITNHGRMHDYVDFYKQCIANNIKPIIGNEIYEVDSLDSNNRYHLILLVKNQIGLQNLFKIVSKSNVDNFYYKPIITLDEIATNHWGEGLICLTACQAGRMSIGLNNNEDMYPYYNKLCSIFDYVCLELQSHKSEEQYKSNKNIIDFAISHNIPYTITCDSHMLLSNDVEKHSIFVEIGQAREVGETYQDCYLQTYNDIVSTLDNNLSLDEINNACIQSTVIADMIQLVDIGLENDNQMPDINKLLPSCFNNTMEWFNSIIEDGWSEKKHGLEDNKFQNIRRERLATEIPVLSQLGYIDYFIMCHLLLKEARKQNIPIGLARGSAAGCLCAYYMGITAIDSITWELDFSRFATLGRVDMADFDIDISKKYRKKMIQIAQDLFGYDCVAPICTFNTMSTKVAIRDIGAVLDRQNIYDIPYDIRNKVAKMIPTITTLDDLGESEEKETLLRDILFQNHELEQYYKKYPKWFEYVMDLEGLPKSLGKHAAGVIISPKPIVEYCPLCLDKDEKSPMIQLEMHNAMDDIRLIKLDFLGLKTLDIIDESLQSAKLTWDDVSIESLDFNDTRVFEEIYQSGNTHGIFQMESYEAAKMCAQCKTSSIEDVIAVNAFNRPGTKDNFPTYVQNKLFNIDVDLIHNDLKPIFQKTNSVLLYQEQALNIFRLAGFVEEEVEIARKAIGKKIKEKMESLHNTMEVNLAKKEWSKIQISQLWDLLLKQSGYSFNRSHSCAYGITSYITAWLKCYYPTHFMCALMNNNMGNYSKLFKNIDEARRMDITILPPDINISAMKFTVNQNTILFGLNGIKGIGKSALVGVVEQRPYSDVIELINKNKDNKLNISNIVALIKAGALGTNKTQIFKQVCRYSFTNKNSCEYKPVVTTPSNKKLLDVGIDIPNTVDNYKETRLALWNEHKAKLFNDLTNQKYKQFKNEFISKYMTNKHLWEFETLSMFLTHNPFQKGINAITEYADDYEGKVTAIGIIFDIDKKKDKKNQQYAFVEFYNGKNIVELIFWAYTYSKYQQGIFKGSTLAVYGTKEGNTIRVEKVQPYVRWAKLKGI